MLIYKQRYKPRTAREFTGTAIDVYDSAGNTALNALTVYGKSEVVGGSIVSAGEGWATVDLGTLEWSYYDTAYNSKPFVAHIENIKIPTLATIIITTLIGTGKYTQLAPSEMNSSAVNNVFAIGHYFSTTKEIQIIDSDYTDATAFKNSLNGVLLCYQEATPTNNAIAVKTDDGTGIDGTMATFSTGTPLRGISDTTVRDVMEWDGTSGEVTKACNGIVLANLTWQWSGEGPNSRFYATLPVQGWADNQETRIAWICDKYTAAFYSDVFYHRSDKILALNRTGESVQIYDSSYNNLSDFTAALGDAELVYELATPTTQSLTSTENASIAGLRTFAPNTHAQNNAQTKMTVDYTIRVPTV